jgi:hypothetical protein
VPDYKIYQVTINKNGLNIVVKYRGNTFLPVEFSIYLNDSSLRLTYPFELNEYLDAKIDETKKEIIIQTHPIKKDPWASYKLFTNRIYNFEISFTGPRILHSGVVNQRI